MLKIHHLNCGTLILPGYPTVVCHCLLVETPDGLVLVDSGIGLADTQDPVGRLGQELIDLAGFQFHEWDTAVRRLEALGFSAGDVRHIVLTHADPDHTGGLADFPHAEVHLAEEELRQVESGHWRYVPEHFALGPNWRSYGASSETWFGIEARWVDLAGSGEILLIPLFGHTLGHCGVAVHMETGWLLHVGDAYYLRAELEENGLPVSELAAQRADDDTLRVGSLSELRRLHTMHADEIEMVGYHDIHELKPQVSWHPPLQPGESWQA